jgi:AraC-like DNA-binding protein
MEMDAKGEAAKSERCEYRLEEPQIVDADEEMMNRLMAVIEKRISDENLKIDEIAEAVGLGRTVFYEKIRELVGVSPSDFLKQVRMQRACQLLAKSRLSIAEVAYAIGFTDPKYFAKCFKKDTGMTPTEYRNKTN